jgi:hypothetical protein
MLELCQAGGRYWEAWEASRWPWKLTEYSGEPETRKSIYNCDFSRYAAMDGALRVISKPLIKELPEPKHRRAILTIAPDTRPQLELEISRPTFKRYSEEFEADYIELTDIEISNHPCGNKYVLTQVSERYEQTLLVDTDIVIMPDAPDIFCEVPLGKWGLVDDMENLVAASGEDWIMSEMQQICDAIGIENEKPNRAWNSGLFIAPPDAIREYYPPVQPVPFLWCVEQHLHTLNLLQSERVVDLPLRWQAGYPWVNFPEAIKTAYTIHLNGCHGPHSIRLNLMRHFAAGNRDIPIELSKVYEDGNFHKPWWCNAKQSA